MLAAKPKIGKSWLMLGVCRAVACGGVYFDCKVTQGAVLYAALEDGLRRLKGRMAKLASGQDASPSALTFWTKMAPLEDGGIGELRAWNVAANNPRLIVIDTFAKVRSPKGRNEESYAADYRQAGMLKALADETGVAIVVVHHTRKMEADDPLDAVSGTTGLTGAADTILVLKRGSDGGVTLFGRGRDIEEFELAVEFDKQSCRWRSLGDASEVRRSAQRQAILDALAAEDEPMTPAAVTAVTGMGRSAVRRLMTKVARTGELKSLGKGKYVPA